MIFLYVVLPQYLVSKFAPAQSLRLNPVSQLVWLAPDPTPTPSPTPSPTPGLTPATFILPKLNISTAVERVGLTETQNMDVPKNTANVAWYMHGKMPGEEGNSVIAGHYDTATGKPAIFYKLRILEVGDEVIVISENALKSVFVVAEKATIPYDKFPSEEVFKSRPGKNLNLITCGGIWDARKRTYLDRIVVYTTLKETTDGV